MTPYRSARSAAPPKSEKSTSLIPDRNMERSTPISHSGTTPKTNSPPSHFPHPTHAIQDLVSLIPAKLPVKSAREISSEPHPSKVDLHAAPLALSDCNQLLITRLPSPSPGRRHRRHPRHRPRSRRSLHRASFHRRRELGDRCALLHHVERRRPLRARPPASRRLLCSRLRRRHVPASHAS